MATYRYGGGRDGGSVTAASGSEAARKMARKRFGRQGRVESFQCVRLEWDADRWWAGVGDIGGKGWSAVLVRRERDAYGGSVVTERETVALARGDCPAAAAESGRWSGRVPADNLASACSARIAPKFRSVASFVLDVALAKEVTV